MKQCNKCLLPETHETIEFNSAGACNICESQDFRNSKIDWDLKKKELDELIGQYRGKYDYDCIVPFSGGKDSTYALYYLVKEYGLKPLVVRFDHGFMRPNLEKNVKKIQRALGIDMITFTPNWKAVQKLMLQSFLDKGDFCWHCHTGIFSYPMWVALEKKIPLIFWGEPSSEYTAYFSYDQPESVDEERFNRFVNLGINSEDMFFRLGGTIDQRDLKPYSYPPLSELKDLKYQSVCLGSYIKWDVAKQSETIMKELDWTGDEVENVPPKYSYEKIECYMQGVRDYIKYIKRGYSRTAHLSALDLRGGKISQSEAKEQIDHYDGKTPPSLELFLDFIGLSEAEFYEIAERHMVEPWRNQVKKDNKGNKLKDFEQWERTGSMDEKISSSILRDWKDGNGF